MKAVIYARVSTLEQDTERQILDLTKKANSDGYTEVKLFEDKISGTTDAKSRKGFEDMERYILENNITQVYCSELSRFGRNVGDIYKNIQHFRNKGIFIYIQKENINTKNNDANTQLQLNILSSIAEYEISTIKSRTLSGMYNSVAKGGVGAGAVKQYGYKKENGKLVIDEEEAEVIRDIVDKYLNKDFNILQITDYLNAKGIKTRYRKLLDEGEISYKFEKDAILWSTSSVARLLHKRLLTGWRVYGLVEYQDENLRILDNQTFEALQAKMASKRDREPNAQKYENIFKGIITCGNCGGTITMTKSSVGKQNHYKCFKKVFLKSGCTSSYIDIDLLNNKIYNITKDFKVDSVDILEKIEKLNEKIELLELNINRFRNDVSELKEQDENFIILFSRGRLSLADYESKADVIKEKIDSLNAEIAKQEAEVVKYKNEISDLATKRTVDLTNPDTFKANIKGLIESIEVKTLNQEEVNNLHLRPNFSQIIKTFTTKVGEEVRRMNEAEHLVFMDLQAAMSAKVSSKIKVYELTIKMFDGKTTYNPIFTNKKTPDTNVITIERI